MIWEVEILPRAINGNASPQSSQGYLLEGELTREQVQELAHSLLVDTLVEEGRVGTLNEHLTSDRPVLTVLLKPGVMDPVAQSVLAAAADLRIVVREVRTYRRYYLASTDGECDFEKGLANDAIEQLVRGSLAADHLAIGKSYEFQVVVVPIRDLDDDALMKLSREGQLALNLSEMKAIQAHFHEQKREPTDIELETIAQTWSEHCSHKTLKGPIDFTDASGHSRRIQNLLKETIFGATQELRQRWGANDWCVSVFSDNAGIVKFNDQFNVCFKVETHNHPSAIEPYGGANTGLGGVIRDVLGTGLGAKPICNTDVFCFAPPEGGERGAGSGKREASLGQRAASSGQRAASSEQREAESPLFPLPASRSPLPDGILHPRKIMTGVVSGVRDYGNRMGIPTVNGAICFDERYLGNPLVYCGTVGLIPVDQCFKQTKPGDLIVALGGRTGRDGIHGATFSSLELTSESETVSGGAVQIGNAITEKKVLDVLLQARDRGLYTAITDCGAGGFSSAIGEMGAELGAWVALDHAPLKYEGLSYTEIWISEAQERMVLSVPPDNWLALKALCDGEDVEAAILGTFESSGRLKLHYKDQLVGDLSMQFLHDGRPEVVRSARTAGSESEDSALRAPHSAPDFTDTLKNILASYSVCSKEWIIRQYDHEVQGGTVIKPLVGIREDGPGDAAVICPVLGSFAGLAVGCGINPRYGDLDPYAMAAAVIDEAVRNVVAVGADPTRIALLDNFCWGNTDRPEVLGSLVRAAEACRDVALAFGTPFISGKDSLNNEFRAAGRHIVIPPTLLISALGRVADVRRCVTMDLKVPGNDLYLIGETKAEMGGSHFHLVHGLTGGTVPHVNRLQAPNIFRSLHAAIVAGLIRSCHDLSEGGLAVAAAEMAFAGEIGADLSHAGTIEAESDEVLLFSESATRFLVEVPRAQAAAFERLFDGLPLANIGRTVQEPRLRIAGANGEWLIWASLADLKEAWQKPLRW